MNGIDVILAALTAAVAKLSETVVKDAYESVKGLIKTKFQGNTAITTSLDEFEKNPKAWEGGLKASLDTAGAANDPEIMAAIQKLQSQLENHAASPSGINASQTGNNNTLIAVNKLEGGITLNQDKRND